ncbi:MAG: DUF2155 domain-containing protein [Alphaproteobacteria bacterium]|jgi:hypothetical protein|nr:DUF2155 domain-containing protein [Alphaproteobacteria bacterium]
MKNTLKVLMTSLLGFFPQSGFTSLNHSIAQQKVPLLAKKLTLRGLDKVTGHVQTLELAIGEEAKFGKLQITARQCRTSLPEDPPEALAFLEITETSKGDEKLPIFTGWMFASAPSISAMEHPVYDIWLVGCEGPTSKESLESTVIVGSLSTDESSKRTAGLADIASSSAAKRAVNTGPLPPEDVPDKTYAAPSPMEEKAQLDAFHRGLEGVEEEPPESAPELEAQ